MMIPVLLLIIAILSGVSYSMYTSLQRIERTCDHMGTQQQQLQCPPCVCVENNKGPDVLSRDRAVNSDPLYPPLNRGPLIMRGDEGTFRLVGYLVAEEDQKDSWKLFGREKDRHRAEFYVTSTDRNMDLKIFLTDDIVTPRMRDMYSLPSTVTIKHPMFTSPSYQLIENPRSDLGSSLYI